MDVNRATYSGCTPLHIAAGRGNIAVVAYLLSMGADPDMQTDEGDTALDLASSDQVRHNNNVTVVMYTCHCIPPPSLLPGCNYPC